MSSQLHEWDIHIVCRGAADASGADGTAADDPRMVVRKWVFGTADEWHRSEITAGPYHAALQDRLPATRTAGGYAGARAGGLGSTAG